MTKKAGIFFVSRDPRRRTTVRLSSVPFLAVLLHPAGAYCSSPGIISENSRASVAIRVSVAPQLMAAGLTDAAAVTMGTAQGVSLCFHSNTATGAYRVSGNGLAVIGADGRPRALASAQPLVAQALQSPCTQPASALTLMAAPLPEDAEGADWPTLLVAPL